MRKENNMKYEYSVNSNNLKPSAIRDIFKLAQRPGVISLSAGNPSPDAFPKAEVLKIANEIFTETPVKALQYSTTDGDAGFIDYMCGFLKEHKGIGHEDDTLIITSGAQQVMQLAAKVLCNPGDVVVAEDPSFVGSLNSFRSNGIKLVGVPMEDDGLCLEALEKAAKENKIKFLYTIPNFQNPTGITMSLEKRKGVYEIAKKYGFIILEDDPYGELYYSGEPLPCIKSMDTEDIVIYAGSFSKVISPGLRVGYAYANKDLIRRMTIMKQADDVHTTILSQLICQRFMEENDFSAYLDGLRKLYGEKLKLTVSLFEKYLAPYGVKMASVNGGLFVWCTLPDKIDMHEFCNTALEKHSVAVVPGDAFLISPEEKTNCFRINFSTPTDADLKEGFKRLGETLKEYN